MIPEPTSVDEALVTGWAAVDHTAPNRLMVDGVEMVPGETWLFPGEHDPARNGVYVVTEGRGWERV